MIIVRINYLLRELVVRFELRCCISGPKRETLALLAKQQHHVYANQPSVLSL